MSKELKMLCSYEEYKNGDRDFVGLSVITAKLMELALKFDKTDEEREEYKKLSEEQSYNNYLDSYTKENYELLDLYYGLKNEHNEDNRNNIYREIGVKYCELQVLIENFNNKYNK